MPRGGRNKKAAHLRLIQGTLRRDRAGGKAPAPRPIAARPPKGLSSRARAFWRSLALPLERAGLLTELDGWAFGVLCEAHARWEITRRRLQALERRVGQATTREQLMMLRKAEGSVEAAEFSFRQLAAEFGLTPAARSRLDVHVPFGGASAAENDALESEFFAEKYLGPKKE